MRGVTGPIDVFDGVKGYIDAVAGKFRVKWVNEDLEAVLRTSLKRYNAEVHSQSAIEGIVELNREHLFTAQDIDDISVEIFDEALEIIGGGEAGARQTRVEHKEEADHSLAYVLAVAILDGDVWPEQYRPERIVRPDVQELLRRVRVRPHSVVPGLRSKWLDTYSWRYPDQMPCRITVTLRDGRTFTREKRDYHGFFKRPLSWDWTAQKFQRLSAGSPIDAGRVIDLVSRLERVNVRELTTALRRK
jgi:2-methylcitrate dehydratase